MSSKQKQIIASQRLLESVPSADHVGYGDFFLSPSPVFGVSKKINSHNHGYTGESGTFHNASPGAKTIQVETSRAFAIAVFYSMGILVGGVGAPLLFGSLIASHSRTHVGMGYLLGLVGGVCEHSSE